MTEAEKHQLPLALVSTIPEAQQADNGLLSFTSLLVFANIAIVHKHSIKLHLTPTTRVYFLDFFFNLQSKLIQSGKVQQV